MAEPLQRRPEGGYGRPGESYARPGDALARPRGLSRFDDEEEEMEPAEAPELGPESRWARLYDGHRLIVALLVLGAGVASTGLVGGQLIAHTRRLQDAVPVPAGSAMDWSLPAFLVAAGLFMGVAFAGVIGRKVWAWVAIVGLASTIATAWIFAGSMGGQLRAFLDASGSDCSPAVMRTAVGGLPARPQRILVCQSGTTAAGAKPGARPAASAPKAKR